MYSRHKLHQDWINPVYPLSPYLMMPYHTVPISAQQANYYRMSKISFLVEWGFGKVELYCSFFDFQNHKLLLQVSIYNA